MSNTMKAVAYRQALPIDDPLALEDVRLPVPTPGPHDLRVRVRAIAVNPVDTKVRRSSQPAEGQLKVLGWDAVGTVDAVGAEVQRFQPGDRVFYAGSIARPGANSELHLVDERIVALAPATLGDAEAAALPLTAITAWELLFDRLQVPRGGGAGRALMIVGGAGGVGSMLIQLARQLTQLTVIATASRPETREWCLSLGAHHVVDHSQPLSQALRAAGLPQVHMVAGLTETQRHWAEIIESVRPQGAIALIDDPDQLDALKLKRKSLSLRWELMFTRSLYETDDMAEQGTLLREVASLIDAGTLRTTLGERFGAIDAANLRRAHGAQETGRTRGKIVLEGF